MPVVRVISALGCLPCERVKLRLEEIQARHTDLTVEDVDLPGLEAALGFVPAGTEGRTAHRGDAERLYPAGLSQADSVNDSAAWRSCGETTNRQG